MERTVGARAEDGRERLELDQLPQRRLLREDPLDRYSDGYSD